MALNPLSAQLVRLIEKYNCTDQEKKLLLTLVAIFQEYNLNSVLSVEAACKYYELFQQIPERKN